MLYTLRFFSSKCSLFHNSNLFGSCIIHILYTECAKIKKNNSGAKRLISFPYLRITVSCIMGTLSFLRVKSGRGVTVTPHPLPVPWWRKSRAIPTYIREKVNIWKTVSGWSKRYNNWATASTIEVCVFLTVPDQRGFCFSKRPDGVWSPAASFQYIYIKGKSIPLHARGAQRVPRS